MSQNTLQELVYFGSNTGKTVLNTSSTEQVITAADLQTGAHLSTYKKTSSPKNGIFVSDYRLYCLQTDQSLLFTYNHNKESHSQKIPLPEKLTCLTVSPNETYLAAGGPTGRLLIWELASGNLVFEQDTHYQGINCLKFTKDECFLFTGGQDARVMAWRVLDLVSISKDDFNVQPVYSWTEHSLPVTDIQIGYGSSAEARVYTASLDQTCRVWDVRTGQQLTAFILPSKITSLCIDPAERVIYTGLENGAIQKINLYVVNPHSGFLQSRGGAKQMITVEDNRNSGDTILAHHTNAVTALSLSFDASLLVSGDSAGYSVVWDLPSSQVSRQLKQHKGPISSIFTIIRDKNQMVDRDQPLIQMFKRMVDTQALDQHEIVMKIGSHSADDQGGYAASDSSMLDDLKQVAAQSGQFMNSDSQSGLQAKVQQLQGDLDQLHHHYGELRSMHDQLWQIHVNQKLN